MATKPQGPVIGDGSLHVGDRVVYPNQGICRITGVEVKQIAGQNWEVVTLSREEDGATVMVPKAKVMGIGLRKVAQADEIEKVFDMLAAPSNDPQLDWKVRHRENADRMSGGGLMGTVEVLKGLNSLARVRPLPAKERELYDNARHLLIGEIAAAMNIPNHVAEDNLDYALWPPEGMTRKGRALEPATLGPPPARAASGDDDLGFDDEETPDLEEVAPKPVAPEASPDADEEGGEEEEAPPPAKPKPAGKPAPAAKKGATPAAPAAVAAVATTGAAAPKKLATAAQPKPAPAKAAPAKAAPAKPAVKSAPAASKKAAPPAKKAAPPKKVASARKPAAKKPAPAKKSAPAARKAKARK